MPKTVFTSGQVLTATHANSFTQEANAAITGGTINGLDVTKISALTASQIAAGATNVLAVTSTNVLVLPDGSIYSYTINDIGVPGGQGFGVGIAPSLPTGFSMMSGTTEKASDNYGNYQYSDGSIMCYIPAFYYKYGTGTNGLTVNLCDIKPYSAYSSESAANTAGYALHRAFYNGGTIRQGFFVDKYLVSKNGSIASSIKNGIVLTSTTRGGLANSAFSDVGADNAFYGSIAVAKTRGASFHVKTMFEHAALALLSLAHASASASTTYNAWYSSGTTNFPKGNNNNALGDANDASILYTWDGNATYAGCGKTGSANSLAKTTHNGQACGVADLNGLVWEITPIGLTTDGSNYHILKTSVDVNTLTSGVGSSVVTDIWGAAGRSTLYTSIGTTCGALNAASIKYMGNGSNKVLSEDTTGNNWSITGAGIPTVNGTSATNNTGNDQFGKDYCYDTNKTEFMCPFVGGAWANSSTAGVFALGFIHVRGVSIDYCGCRSALYL